MRLQISHDGTVRKSGATRAQRRFQTAANALVWAATRADVIWLYGPDGRISERIVPE